VCPHISRCFPPPRLIWLPFLRHLNPVSAHLPTPRTIQAHYLSVSKIHFALPRPQTGQARTVTFLTTSSNFLPKERSLPITFIPLFTGTNCSIKLSFSIKYCSHNIVRMIKSRTMRWEGHVARMGERRGLYKVWRRKTEGKRPLGRPWRRWVDNDMIYLLNAIGLSSGGSSTVHIYTQTVHRTTQNKQYIEQHNNLGKCGPCPVLASYTLVFALQVSEKSTEKPQSG